MSHLSSCQDKKDDWGRHQERQGQEREIYDTDSQPAHAKNNDLLGQFEPAQSLGGLLAAEY